MNQNQYVCPHCGAAGAPGQEICNYCGLPITTRPPNNPPQQDAYARVEPGAETARPAYPPIPQPTYVAAQQKRKSPLPWILGIAAVFILVCGGISAFVVSTGFSLISNLSQESTAAQGVLKQFMQAGAANDPDAGWALFSSSVGASASRESVSVLFENHSEYFANFDSFDVGNYMVYANTSGTTSTLAGKVKYKGGNSLPFSAQLKKEGNDWKLLSIQFSQGVGP